ncbi:hypothetical protein J2Z76_002443 [Sedimentibacter acidaminivorans]|uniref:Peptidase S8/S53 domain-containing protein n=1 Tax=Sedimentibacter acidaminivorans TaxID=913099 RepID=A0ABS4GFZ1_9FIRM|nr:S8 family peptidase [Sedimentibacter acidaminivorans]MBP1926574.1 hypothetical protein [Sedimentibacter acidaminivorans]
MNSLLQLKGRFEQAKNSSTPASSKLPSGHHVKMEKLQSLTRDLIRLKRFWESEDIIPGALVSVYYNKVAAKSNRIKALLSKSRVTANSSIVGARFSDDGSPKHIITHYVSMDLIDKSITLLQKSVDILSDEFKGVITYDDIVGINEKKIFLKSEELARTTFVNVIVDAFYVNKFDILVETEEIKDESIITIYKTDIKATNIMEKIGIQLHFTRVIDDTTILLRPDELRTLLSKAPYLISMAVTDLTKLDSEDFDFAEESLIKIPSPTTEPFIGVIDTMFDQNVYFSDWVEFKNMLPSEITLSPSDYNHGTAVSSIIVDGPASNPKLDDGCGRFRVRHFGVAAGNQFSSFTILRNINEIVSNNKDIKVWNLSLGSKLEINQNFISPEAAILDKIQYENDVIFVIAGTNNSNSDKNLRIGAPADSINSVIVNSVKNDGQPASYTRKGPVLSFFTKPDVSYYGGDTGEYIRVCTPTGEAFVRGTSFAAPWISRKLSYLIDVLGLSREVAKALLIDSSTGWNEDKGNLLLSGHGVVPIKISDIVESQDDEIQFVLYGVSEEYDTYNYNIPVPINKEKHPFIAKATMCYFPACSRNQGVDYTNTELDIQFGRLKENGIKPINNNYQSADTQHHTWEEDARKYFRKWDNVKHIREVYNPSGRAKKAYDKGIWGLSLKTKERLEQKCGVGLKFGIVVTLKEIDGVNRIDEFIKNCALRGWLVNRIDIEQRIDIYNIAEEEIDFSE